MRWKGGLSDGSHPTRACRVEQQRGIHSGPDGKSERFEKRAPGGGKPGERVHETGKLGVVEVDQGSPDQPRRIGGLSVRGITLDELQVVTTQQRREQRRDGGQRRLRKLR
jgi:hypothetical protein